MHDPATCRDGDHYGQCSGATPTAAPSDRDIAAAMFNVFAEHVRQHGKPYPGGEWLRESLHTASLVCEEDGPLPVDHMGADWLTLCGDAMRHAQQTGHRVAVQATQEAIYGPKVDGTDYDPAATSRVIGQLSTALLRQGD